MKAKFKFNNGDGALICHKCGKIAKTSKRFTKEELNAYENNVEINPRYCFDCVNDSVYNFKTKHKEGFTNDEIAELLREYIESGFNLNSFNEAIMGNTCLYDEDDGIIMYQCDLFNAINAGLENRSLNMLEWD